MFGIDFSEILVIFAVALIVLGPERLPKLAATIGRWIGRARAMARQFREQLEQEANAIHPHVDLGSEFSRTGRPTGARAAPTPDAAPEPLRPDPPHAAAPAATATAPMSGFPPLPAELTLADTHPAGLHPGDSAPSAGAITAAAATESSAPVAGAVADTQQGSL
jgi:sec-independent protein translocase protein TatB